MRLKGTRTDWGFEERRRRERNYRFMFKCALSFFALGVVVALLGGAEAVIAGDPALFSMGLMLAMLSGVSAWLSVDSTVRILELDMDEGEEER